MRKVTAEDWVPLPLLVERVLLAMTILGVTFLFIGVPVHLAGRAYNDFGVAQVGAWMLLIGIILVVMRIFYWFLEEIVGRAIESMMDQNGLQIVSLRYRLPSIIKPNPNS